MSALDLRPLSIGELLDRTLSLYRRNFLLLVGISVFPYLLVLAFQLAQLAFATSMFPFPLPSATEFQSAANGFSVGGVLGVFGFAVLGFIISVIAYLLAQGGTVFAVSELYLGRTTTIGQSMRRVRGELLSFFVLVFLDILIIGFSVFFFIIPALYVACRLSVSFPAALLENLNPFNSIQRSLALTRDNAGRAFLILLFYAAILYAGMSFFALPFILLIRSAAHNPGLLRAWTALIQVASFFSNVLITPILTTACAIFYFDLRVRKEAFDLQMMMHRLAASVPAPQNPATLLS
jgi:hypothetical protein